MNYTKLGAVASVILVCLVAVPAAAQIPFKITGYVYFPDGSACLDPTVTITNLGTGAVLPVMTLSSSNYYQAKPAPQQNEISEGDVLEFKASAGTESAVIEHRISASDLNSALSIDITLGTTKTATVSGPGDPPLPQAPTISPGTATPTSTSTATSTLPDETHTPGFEIVPALAIIIAYLVLGQRL
jgi:hypothetical protein